jgi:hypothetical protein
MNYDDLNTEQKAAVTKRTDSYNAASNAEPLTAQAYLDRGTLAQIDAWVEADYQAELARLGSAFRPLPIETRRGVIAQLEGTLEQLTAP